MADMVLMPQMGVSEESAILAKWLVKVGDAVKNGTALFSLETGKSAFECLAEKDGIVLALFIPEGEEVKIGTPVCAIGAEGEKVETPSTSVPSANVSIPADAVAQDASASVVPSAVRQTEDGVTKASPRAKMFASRSGIDFTKAIPTGPDGRIIERDVRELAVKGAVVPDAFVSVPESSGSSVVSATESFIDYEDKPLSGIRKAIAKNMMKSLSEMAQLTLNRTFNASDITAFRAKCKNSGKPIFEGVTLNDLILYSVAHTLPAFPELNANLIDGKMRYFKGVHLGVAVDTPRGLMVPVIRSAEKLSLCALSAEVKRLSSACREGTVKPSELSGGSFTVSNLGASGIESFTPVINPPQTGILGVDTVALRPMETSDGIKFYKAMGLSLTFDHRALDGSPAALFLKAVSEKLENFSLTLAE